MRRVWLWPLVFAALFLFLPPPPAVPPAGKSGLFPGGLELTSPTTPPAPAPLGPLAGVFFPAFLRRRAGAARPRLARGGRRPERRRYLVLGRLLLEGG